MLFLQHLLPLATNNLLFTPQLQDALAPEGPERTTQLSVAIVFSVTIALVVGSFSNRLSQDHVVDGMKIGTSITAGIKGITGRFTGLNTNQVQEKLCSAAVGYDLLPCLPSLPQARKTVTVTSVAVKYNLLPCLPSIPPQIKIKKPALVTPSGAVAWSYLYPVLGYVFAIGSIFLVLRYAPTVYNLASNWINKKYQRWRRPIRRTYIYRLIFRFWALLRLYERTMTLDLQLTIGSRLWLTYNLAHPPLEDIRRRHLVYLLAMAVIVSLLTSISASLLDIASSMLNWCFFSPTAIYRGSGYKFGIHPEEDTSFRAPQDHMLPAADSMKFKHPSTLEDISQPVLAEPEVSSDSSNLSALSILSRPPAPISTISAPISTPTVSISNQPSISTVSDLILPSHITISDHSIPPTFPSQSLSGPPSSSCGNLPPSFSSFRNGIDHLATSVNPSEANDSLVLAAPERSQSAEVNLESPLSSCPTLANTQDQDLTGDTLNTTMLPSVVLSSESSRLSALAILSHRPPPISAISASISVPTIAVSSQHIPSTSPSRLGSGPPPSSCGSLPPSFSSFINGIDCLATSVNPSEASDSLVLAAPEPPHWESVEVHLETPLASCSTLANTRDQDLTGDTLNTTMLPSVVLSSVQGNASSDSLAMQPSGEDLLIGHSFSRAMVDVSSGFGSSTVSAASTVDDQPQHQPADYSNLMGGHSFSRAMADVSSNFGRSTRAVHRSRPRRPQHIPADYSNIMDGHSFSRAMVNISACFESSTLAVPPIGLHRRQDRSANCSNLLGGGDSFYRAMEDVSAGFASSPSAQDLQGLGIQLPQDSSLVMGTAHFSQASSSSHWTTLVIRQRGRSHFLTPEEQTPLAQVEFGDLPEWSYGDRTA